MIDEYSQIRIIHCPIKKCKGMLLSNPCKHELKCSDCGKYFMESTRYEEVPKPKE